MKNKSFTLSKVATATGFLLGAFALSVLAASWTPPECDPPECNTWAPLNVGSDHQYKSGPISLTGLSLGKTGAPEDGFIFDVSGVARVGSMLVTGDIQVEGLKVGGTDASKSGYVLTNSGPDANGYGIAMWKPAGSSNTGSNVINVVNINNQEIPFFSSDYCYATDAGRAAHSGALKGYYLKGLIKFQDDNWDSVGGVYCLIKGNSDPRMTEQVKDNISSGGNKYQWNVIRSTIGMSYNAIVTECNANPHLYRAMPSVDKGSIKIGCPPYDEF